MSERKQLVVNVAANFVYILINYIITFFLTSFVVSEISEEAYGFISLCNNVINYAALVTIALNSVAGRFITIEMHRHNFQRANRYFSSTLAADFIICIGIIIAAIPIANNIDSIFEIPAALINDVRTLFLLVACNFIITVISAVYTVGTFITNKLYLSSLANAIGNIIRAAALTYFMYYRHPSIKYVGISTVISSVMILVLNIIYTNKLCPQLRIKKTDISLHFIKELLASGIWNSVTRLAQILSDGIDLLISNIWVGAYAMGQLSIAYTIPTIASTFLSMIVNIFSPKLTEYYAKEDIVKIVEELKLNMKMTGFFGNVLFFGLVTMGKDFFGLWVPTANIDMIYVLMIVATISLLVSSITSPLSNVFLLTNKLKVNSLVWLGVSIFDIIIVLILLKTTALGVYAVAGVSKIVGSMVNLLFLPIYASKCLKVKTATFYSLILKYGAVTLGVGGGMCIAGNVMGSSYTWGYFIVRSIILAAIGMTINYKLFLNREERIYLQKTILQKIRKRQAV